MASGRKRPPPPRWATAGPGDGWLYEVEHPDGRGEWPYCLSECTARPSLELIQITATDMIALRDVTDRLAAPQGQHGLDSTLFLRHTGIIHWLIDHGSPRDVSIRHRDARFLAPQLSRSLGKTSQFKQVGK